MKFCTKCGKEIHDDAVFCVHCGCATEAMNRPAAVNDAPSGGFWALGFFIPLAGFILYLVDKDTRPLRAKSAGKGALTGFLTGLAFWILYIVVFAVIIASI